MQPELINGKLYHPVEGDGYFDCDSCTFGYDDAFEVFCKEPSVKCLHSERKDNKNVYFINIDGEL